MPTKFDFVSPGVELREIDQSIISPSQEADGIVLIGQAKQGPSMKVVKVSTLQDYVDVFGNPVDGTKNDDPWRLGNTGAPSYAGYAAQAYLAAGVGPVKFIRLGGLAENAGDAGWDITNNAYTASALANEFSGAIGLFVADSGSTANQSATLAAIFYMSGSSLGLAGTDLDGTIHPDTAPAATTFILGSGASNKFTMVISGSGTTSKTLDFDFDPASPIFIRNVFNTDPTLFAAGAGPEKFHYFLGESFETQVQQLSKYGTSAGLTAFVAGIKTSENYFSEFHNELTPSKSGWFIGVKPDQKKLFRFEALHDGEEFQKKHYVRVKDLSLSSAIKREATFTVQVMKYGQVSPVETFAGVNLNPDSPNFIGKKIGDLKQTWHKTKKKFLVSGKFNNASSYIRVEVAPGIARTDLPVGFLGPKLPATATIDSTSPLATVGWVYGQNQLPFGNSTHTVTGAATGAPSYSIDIDFPNHVLTDVNNQLVPSKTFGLCEYSQKGYDKTIGDVGILRDAIPDMHIEYGDSNSVTSYQFSLEELTSSNDRFYYLDLTNPSISDVEGVDHLFNTVGIKQFAAPFFGGFDGNSILVSNPYNDDAIDNGSYEKFTIDQAMEIVGDKDLIRYDLISMPGITTPALLSTLVNQTTERGDALAIIDLDGIQKSTDDTGTNIAKDASINTAIQFVNDQLIDSSYVASYFPNVRLQDTLGVSNTTLVVPPSVAAIGAIAASEASSQPWFAPAGFNRGGLSILGGSKGPRVLGTVEHLTKDERDSLYEVNINPIARFPATGDTVIFGQKTMQQANSALDRINVRRMMIFLKKQIGDIADTILFDNNVNSTWERFKSKAQPVLAQLQTQFGISEYKLVLDETTTTADLIDRNIMYAKVYVKPARAIEFIAIDFVITQTGVEF